MQYLKPKKTLDSLLNKGLRMGIASVSATGTKFALQIFWLERRDVLLRRNGCPHSAPPINYRSSLMASTNEPPTLRILSLSKK